MWNEELQCEVCDICGEPIDMWDDDICQNCEAEIKDMPHAISAGEETPCDIPMNSFIAHALGLDVQRDRDERLDALFEAQKRIEAGEGIEAFTRLYKMMIDYQTSEAINNYYDNYPDARDIAIRDEMRNNGK